MKYVIILDGNYHFIDDIKYFENFTKEQLVTIYVNNILDIMHYEALKELVKRDLIDESELNKIPMDELLITNSMLELIINDKELIRNKLIWVKREFIKKLNKKIKL